MHDEASQNLSLLRPVLETHHERTNNALAEDGAASTTDLMESFRPTGAPPQSARPAGRTRHEFPRPIHPGQGKTPEMP